MTSQTKPAPGGNLEAGYSDPTDIADSTKVQLDSPFKISIFSNISGNVVSECDVPDIDALRKWFEMQEPCKIKKLGALLKLATFGKTRTACGSFRSNANVTSVSGIECDYDEGVISIHEAVAAVQSAGLEGLLYLSYSHTDDKPRWRLLCPLSKPVEPAARLALAERANGVFGGKLAIESAVISQSFFFQPKEGALTVFVTNGKRIDELDLPRIPFGVKATQKTIFEVKPTAPSEPDYVEWISQQTIEDLESALRGVPSDDYAPWIRIGLALRGLGDPGFVLWDDWSKKSTKYNQKDVAAKWATLQPCQIGYRTVFAEAMQLGWINPLSGSGYYPCADQTDGTDGDSEGSEGQATGPSSIEDEFSDIPDRLINFASVGGILEIIQNHMMETAPVPNLAASAAAALALLGTILANKVQSKTGLRTNNQIVVVAATGTGKDHPRKVNKAVLAATGLDETRLGGEEVSSGQGVMTAAANRPTALFQLDEFGLLLQACTSDRSGSWQKAILAAYMKLHSSSGQVVPGTEYADQKQKERRDIKYPCVNLFATTTAAELMPALKSSHIASGYANRMLFILSKSRRQKRNMTENLGSVPPEIVDWVNAAIGYRGTGLTAGTIPSNPVKVDTSGEAYILFDEFESWILMEQDLCAIREAMFARSWEHAAKLAMIVAMSRMSLQQLQDCEPCEVSGDDAAWAIEFVKFTTEEMIRLIKARVVDTIFEGQCMEVLRLVKKSGQRGATERDLAVASRIYRGLEVRIRDQILSALQRNGDIKSVTFDILSRRGRARTAWVSCK